MQISDEMREAAHQVLWERDQVACSPATITAALEAALSAAEPSVAVKALEWHDRHDMPLRENDLLAESVVGQFAIRPSSTGSSYRLFIPWMHYNDAKVFSSVEDAKRYAQADYEARIRSALTAQVQDVAGWHPITNAPKDGMTVDLWDSVAQERVADARFINGNWKIWGQNGFGRMEWVTVSRQEDFTYFMHLPSAPSLMESKP